MLTSMLTSVQLPKRMLTSHDGTKQLDLSRPHVMGILNVTPDSFSDGGQFNAIDTALRHCEQMLNEGASIIDIGGESTRPNATPVSTDEELNRGLPVVPAIRQVFGDEVNKQDGWLSIDTSTPEVIDQSVQAGADIWNDVRALSRDGAGEMAGKLGVPVILMHNRGEPDTMDDLAVYDDVMSEVKGELQHRIDYALSCGVKPENIVLDLGFGFAKNHAQHQVLLKNMGQFLELGYPMLFGISRKRYLAEVLNQSDVRAFANHAKTDRDPIGMATALLAITQGTSIIRTHNVGMTMQAVALWQDLYG